MFDRATYHIQRDEIPQQQLRLSTLRAAVGRAVGHLIVVRLRKSVLVHVEERHAKLSHQMPFTLPTHVMWYIYNELIPASSPHFKFLTTADLHIDSVSYIA